jgi:hypothetical protein
MRLQGRLLVEFKQYSEAQKYLKRAFKATAGSTLHNKATAEYEIALQFVAFENRQAVNSADKARWVCYCPAFSTASPPQSPNPLHREC